MDEKEVKEEIKDEVLEEENEWRKMEVEVNLR